tara:strand:+ start:68 stop:439 length:372 start_codon:yes stop_codon:yes gene_type:complete
MIKVKNIFKHSSNTKFPVKVLIFIIIVVGIVLLAKYAPPSIIFTQPSQQPHVDPSTATQCSMPWSKCPKNYYCNRNLVNPVCEQCPTDNIPRHCPCGEKNYGKCGYGTRCQKTFPGVEGKVCL